MNPATLVLGTRKLILYCVWETNKANEYYRQALQLADV
jgi:hypothetical protein